MEQLIFHMNVDMGGANWSAFSDLFRQLGIRAFVAIVLTVAFGVALKRIESKIDKTQLQVFGCVIAMIPFLISLFFVTRTIYRFTCFYGMNNYLVSKTEKSQLFEDYYVDPETATIIAPAEKKNLIYIVLESMEITNADTNVGGAYADNRIPGLTELALENGTFSGDSNRINGVESMLGTTWTVASLAAQTSGVPLIIPADGNSYGTTEFLPGAYSIGEVLEVNGYHNYFLMGSDASFAGRDTYFTEHGNYELLDYYWAIETGKIDEDYDVWWGFEDEKLFEYARDELLMISENDEPFNFSILTADTHFTEGYVCELCQNNYDRQYTNVIACSDQQVTEFVRWVQQQAFYEDTVIVIVGDHAYMDSTYYSDVALEYDRRMYFTIINSECEQPGYERVYTAFDLYPTTLVAVGFEIEGNRLGLGTDLYSDSQTLSEEMGINKLYYEISLGSNYYDRVILYGHQFSNNGIFLRKT